MECDVCQKIIDELKYICDECSTKSEETNDTMYQDYHSSGRDENGDSY